MDFVNDRHTEQRTWSLHICHGFDPVFFINRTSQKEPVLCKLLEFFSSLGAEGMINGTSMDMCIFTSANLIMSVKT